MSGASNIHSQTESTSVKVANMPALTCRLLLAVMSITCCSATFAATTRCQSDLHHFTPPAHAYVDEVFPLNGPQLVRLFSQDGVDVYSATDFRSARFLQQRGQSFDGALTVLLVYQDERTRQRKIDSLRKTVETLRALTGVRLAPLRNLKYATWRFELTPVWTSDVLSRRWMISGVAYFEPPSCVANPRTQTVPSFLPASQALDSGNFIGGEMPPAAIPPNRRSAPTPGSVLARALAVMRQLEQRYGVVAY